MNFADAMAQPAPDATWRMLGQYGGLGFTAIAAMAVSIWAAPGLGGIFGAGLAVLMVVIAFIDARHFIIPNALTFAALALAIVDAALQQGWDGVLTASLRGVVLASVFFAARFFYRRLRKREGIGLGDVKLAGVAGAWLTWTMLPIAVEVAALVALAVYTMLWLVGGRAVQRLTRVPFGLFFAPAIWLGWLLETIFALT